MVSLTPFVVWIVLPRLCVTPSRAVFTANAMLPNDLATSAACGAPAPVNCDNPSATCEWMSANGDRPALSSVNLPPMVVLSRRVNCCNRFYDRSWPVSGGNSAPPLESLRLGGPARDRARRGRSAPRRLRLSCCVGRNSAHADGLEGGRGLV